MCRFEEEEIKVIPNFDLTKYYPDLETTIKDLLFGVHTSIDKLEPINLTPHITERFVNTLESNPRLTVKLVFHGTMTANFPNIQKLGFLVPGKSGVPIMNGNAYGSGIYLSICPKLSLSYVRDHPKLLVCALLEGDKNKVTPYGNIRVAKDPAYVIPCFILHYKGPAPRQSSPFQRLMSNPYIHSLFFCLIALFKAIALLFCISFICFILTLSCLGYTYTTGKDHNTMCYEVNSMIWDIYAYILSSIFYNAIYYMLFIPAYYLWVLGQWILGGAISFISWSLFWMVYFVVMFFVNISMMGLGVCAVLVVGLVYFFKKKRWNRGRKYNHKKSV